MKRLFTGLVVGIAMGGAAAAAFVKGFGVQSFADTGAGALLPYAAALAMGALVALVAGKPIWAKGAWIEVGLKAFFGSLLAAGGMFALRRWGGMSIDLSRIGAGAGPLSALPATSLPILATLLSVLFELDNTESPEEKKGPKRLDGSPRIASASLAKGPRIATGETGGEAEDEAAEGKKKLRS